jgi:hypothetical protein
MVNVNINIINQKNQTLPTLYVFDVESNQGIIFNEITAVRLNDARK